MKTATAPLPPLRSVRFWTSCVSAYAYLHYSLQTEQAYVHWVRAFIRFHGVRHPATWAAAKSRHFCLAGEQAQGFRSPASSGIGGLAVLLRQGAVPGSAGLGIGRPRPSRRLPVVLTRMKWFASSVFWKAASFVRPASVWNRHADQ